MPWWNTVWLCSAAVVTLAMVPCMHAGSLRAAGDGTVEMHALENGQELCKVRHTMTRDPGWLADRSANCYVQRVEACHVAMRHGCLTSTTMQTRRKGGAQRC